jgi:hypothetical protein
VEEGFTEEWLWDMECAGLLRRHSQNPEMRCMTDPAEKKLRRREWIQWRKANPVKDTRDLPLMSPELIAEFEAR